MADETKSKSSGGVQPQRDRLRKGGRTALVAAALTLTTGAAQAQYLDSDLWILVSAFRPTIDSKARVDGTIPGGGTNVDLETDLGLADTKALPSVLLGWRFSESFRLELEYISLKRSGSNSINRDITWDNTVYPLGATVSSAFNTDIYRASVGWSAIRTPTAELGVSLGLHLTRFVAQVSGRGSVSGQPFAQIAEAQDMLVPLPTLGLFGALSLTPSLRLTGRADIFALNYGDYQGSLFNTEAGLSWHFTRNWSAVLGYRYVSYDLDVKKDGWIGSLKYRFNGPSLGVAYAF